MGSEGIETSQKMWNHKRRVNKYLHRSRSRQTNQKDWINKNKKHRLMNTLYKSLNA